MIDAPETVQRDIRGRYLVRVESLAPNGEALACVLETISSPTAEEFARVYRSRPDAPVAALALIGGLPGEMLEVEVVWRLPRPGRRPARRVPPPRVYVLRVHEAAAERVAPRCAVFGECGGCQLQHLEYAAQLEWKTARVRAALVGVGFADPSVTPTLGLRGPVGLSQSDALLGEPRWRRGAYRARQPARAAADDLPHRASPHRRGAGCAGHRTAPPAAGALALRHRHRTTADAASAH